MQVASRLFVVWGVLYPFHGSIVGAKGGDLLGEYGYLGCLLAWGVTECIRYGFFVMQVNGGVETVPGWWQWLRYVIPFFFFSPLTDGPFDYIVAWYANILGRRGQVQYILRSLPDWNQQRVHLGCKGAGWCAGTAPTVLLVYCRCFGDLCSWYVGPGLGVWYLFFADWPCLGSYVMYTHMIKQKGKTAGAKKEGKKE